MKSEPRQIQPSDASHAATCTPILRLRTRLGAGTPSGSNEQRMERF